MGKWGKKESKARSIRFDIEMTAFVMKREKLDSHQAVVDRFLQRYWDHWHVKPDQDELQKAVKQETVSDREPQRPIKPESEPIISTTEIMSDYAKRRRDLENPEQFKQWKEELSTETRLTPKQKQLVLSIGVGGIG